jgi:hypothetical protein
MGYPMEYHGIPWWDFVGKYGILGIHTAYVSRTMASLDVVIVLS